MVIRAGLEPRITALKGLCPYHLDERTRFTGSFLPALGIGCNKNIINAHTEECCKNDQIIDSRERSSTLPLVNRLRGMEPKDNLYVCNGKPSRLPQSYNIGTGQCECSSFTPPVPNDFDHRVRKAACLTLKTSGFLSFRQDDAQIGSRRSYYTETPAYPENERASQSYVPQTGK